jgi:hypothetical protein
MKGPKLGLILGVIVHETNLELKARDLVDPAICWRRKHRQNFKI